jgi:hypothetical protein
MRVEWVGILVPWVTPLTAIRTPRFGCREVARRESHSFSRRRCWQLTSVFSTRVAKSSIAHRCNQGRSTERINVSHWWSPTEVLRDFARRLVPFNLLRMRRAVLSRRQLRNGGHSNNCTEVRLSRRNGSNEYTKVWGL